MRSRNGRRIEEVRQLLSPALGQNPSVSPPESAELPSLHAAEPSTASQGDLVQSLIANPSQNQQLPVSTAVITSLARRVLMRPMMTLKLH